MSNIVEFEISDGLKNQCSGLWSITNNLRSVLDEVSDSAEMGESLNDMKEYVLKNWCREDMINYHMGNIFQRNGVVWWAMKFKSKIQLLRHVLDSAINPIKLEVANNDITLCVRILYSGNNLDHARFCFIQDTFNYYSAMSNDDLYEI